MIPIYPLLGLLLNEGKHGYELKRIVDQEFAPFWRIDFAQMYRSLAKMTREGWVKPHIESGEGAPDRKTYLITARGRQVFEKWIAEPARDRNEFFCKLRLATDAKLPVVQLLESQRAQFESERQTRQQTHQELRDAKNASQLVLAHAALRETEASLAALDLYESVTAPLHHDAKLLGVPVIIGSDDPLLARLAQIAHTSTQAVGSIGGLLALAQHQANVAGVHLRDAETGEYNVPFVKHLLPEDDIVLVNLAVRENGLLVARGNPKNIRGVRDLVRPGIRLINRQRGTGTRLLIYSKLRAAHIDPHALSNWERIANTHDAVAGAIASGVADVGPGLLAVAAEWNLDFIPLGEERYDLAIPHADFESPTLRVLLEALHDKVFRREASALKGYDLARCGRIVARIK
jgi:molybdate-binding protein/DNA-binding PadR family transcriptional regulator